MIYYTEKLKFPEKTHLSYTLLLAVANLRRFEKLK